jgi:hypothetical protein
VACRSSFPGLQRKEKKGRCGLEISSLHQGLRTKDGRRKGRSRKGGGKKEEITGKEKKEKKEKEENEGSRRGKGEGRAFIGRKEKEGEQGEGRK